MARPLVSVVVPCYNHERYVVEALRSVKRQSYRPLEVIIIDDGSSDRSANVVRQYVQDDMPWATFIERPNRGAHATLNEGIALSSGDFITFLNSDDVFSPDRIERCLEAALLSKRGFVFSDVFYLDGSGRRIDTNANAYVSALLSAKDTISSSPSLSFAFLRNQLTITTGNMFFSRALLSKVGYFREYRYVHDWDMVLRAVYFEEPLFLAQEEIYGYRIHGHNSFMDLGSVASYETTEVVRNCLIQMTNTPPINVRAPSPYYWGAIFDIYIQKYRYEFYMPPRFRKPIRGPF